jgi:hypothetical protein
MDCGAHRRAGCGMNVAPATMHSAELAARAHRHRSAAEIEDDLQAACRAIGALAGAARLNARPIDRTALKNVCEGVRRLLAEPVESWREHGQ